MQEATRNAIVSRSQKTWNQDRVTEDPDHGPLVRFYTRKPVTLFTTKKKKEKKTIIKELFWILLFLWKLEIKEKFLKWIFLVYIINKINWCFLSIYYLYNTWNQLGYLIKYLYGNIYTVNHTKIYTLFPLWKKEKGFAGNKCYLMFNMLWWLKVLYFKLFIEIMKNE